MSYFKNKKKKKKKSLRKKNVQQIKVVKLWHTFMIKCLKVIPDVYEVSINTKTHAYDLR
jgi:hypothetical protein